MKYKRLRPILIAGCGNPLMGDDGAGLEALEFLAAAGLPEEVRLLDCGTDILKLSSYLEPFSRVYVIDTFLQSGSSSGPILADLAALAREPVPQSAHRLSLIQALRLLKETERLGRTCDFIFCGIPGSCFKANTTPSAKTREITFELCRRILRQIGQDRMAQEKERGTHPRGWEEQET